MWISHDYTAGLHPARQLSTSCYLCILLLDRHWQELTTHPEASHPDMKRCINVCHLGLQNSWHLDNDFALYEFFTTAHIPTQLGVLLQLTTGQHTGSESPL